MTNGAGTCAVVVGVTGPLAIEKSESCEKRRADDTTSLTSRHAKYLLEQFRYGSVIANLEIRIEGDQGFGMTEERHCIVFMTILWTT